MGGQIGHGKKRVCPGWPRALAAGPSHAFLAPGPNCDDRHLLPGRLDAKGTLPDEVIGHVR